MGFVRANTIPLLRQHRRRPFSGRVLCLGAPDVYFTDEALAGMASAVGAPIDRSAPARLSTRPDFQGLGYLSGDTLLSRLGFAAVDVLDVSPFEGARLIHDLNDPNLPAEWVGRFDAVVDHGTLEHVFHLPHALMNLWRLLKVGGRLMHSSPTSNLVDHGFYMFSPTLFHDFYSANRWAIDDIFVVSMTPRQETEPFFYTEYEPGTFDAVSYGGLGAGMYFTVGFFTKTPESTADVVPQQGAYRRKAGWAAAPAP